MSQLWAKKWEKKNIWFWFDLIWIEFDWFDLNWIWKFENLIWDFDFERNERRKENNYHQLTPITIYHHPKITNNMIINYHISTILSIFPTINHNRTPISTQTQLINHHDITNSHSTSHQFKKENNQSQQGNTITPFINKPLMDPQSIIINHHQQLILNHQTIATTNTAIVE